MCAIINDCDVELISQYRWHALSCNGKFYAATSVGGRKNKKSLLMHRLIMDATPGFEIDHINRDSLDNRRDNLRLCTHAENIRNMKHHIGGSSEYRGVSWNKEKKKWRATIRYNGHSTHLGYFNDETDAAAAYDAAAQFLYGAFAHLNVA